MSSSARVKMGLAWESAGRQSVRDMNLHGSAEEALQKRVVQLLSDAGALSQALIEAGINSRSHLPHPEPVQCRHQEDTACDAGRAKNQLRLEPGGRDARSTVAPRSFQTPSLLQAITGTCTGPGEALCSRPDGVCLRFAIRYPRHPACSERTRARECRDSERYSRSPDSRCAREE